MCFLQKIMALDGLIHLVVVHNEENRRQQYVKHIGQHDEKIVIIIFIDDRLGLFKSN
jgi:hypothetical protein